MRERKFYFIPLERNTIVKKKGNGFEGLYCSVAKNGMVQFTTKSIDELGFKDGMILKFYCDVEKRALAFKIIEKLDNGELQEFKNGSYKELKIRCNKGSKVLVLGFRKFILSLPNSKLPSGKLKIETYKDNELGTELYYFIIPENEDSLKPKINKYYKPSVDN